MTTCYYSVTLDFTGNVDMDWRLMHGIWWEGRMGKRRLETVSLFVDTLLLDESLLTLLYPRPPRDDFVPVKCGRLSG